MQLSFSQEDMLGRILSVHNLAKRCSLVDILSVIEGVGVHTPYQDSLSLFLAPRVDGFTKEMIDPLFEHGELIRTVGVRGSIRTLCPYDWLPIAEALLPKNEHELLYMVKGAKPLLLPLQLSAMQVLSMICDVLPTILCKKQLTKKELGISVFAALGERLTSSEREIWFWPSPLFQQQTLGESLIRFFLPVAALSVPVRLVDDHKSNGFLYTIGEDFIPERTNSQSLAMHYVHAYGPTDSDAFSVWAGISSEHALRLYNQIPDEQLAEITSVDKPAWMLTSDVASMDKLVAPEGIRFISCFDPFLRIAQRHLLIHGKYQYSYFFRSSGAPGMVLADGRCVGGWRMKLRKRRSTFQIEDIGEGLGRVALDELEDEAMRMSKALSYEFEGLSIVEPT